MIVYSRPWASRMKKTRWIRTSTPPYTAMGGHLVLILVSESH